MSSRFTISGLSGSHRENSSTLVSWQLAQRVQLVLSQIAKQKAGAPEAEIVRELNVRLRRLGVVLSPYELREHASRIAGTAVPA